MARALGGVVSGLLLLALAAAVGAQEPGHPPGCLMLAGSVSRELMERPIGLDPGAGRLHQPVSTESPKAQALYDQGIAYLASYAWIPAARSFHAALRLDPKLAMAHLGLARAYEGAEASDVARAHLEQAEALVAADAPVSDKESRWIELGRQQYEAVHAPAGEQHARLLDYRGALDALVALDPDDAHAWVLRGNAEEPGAWGRGQAGGVGSIAFYESALDREPNHLGAHHFLVHSYENIGQHAASVEHARRYAAAAPGVGHAQHMLGHVLPRLGRWKEAREQFLKADAIERASFAAEEIAPEEDWHHGHNLHLLGAVNYRLGNGEQAERAFRRAFELEERGALAGTYAGPFVQYLLLAQRNDEALAAARELAARPSKVGRVLAASLAGEAMLGLGRVDDARAALARAEELGASLGAELADTRYAVFLPAVTTPYIRILRGRVLLRGDSPEEGEGILIELADEVGHNPRLDAWASGALRVERAAADAERLGRPDLAAGIRARAGEPGAQGGR
jgi:tetratricopeptide (TPR) repeat protein